ncbi:MAG TPA: hypothetical protein DEB73_04065 [Candidatus Magasanikbacteria bacterium]|nr:hypothetical protein [Candidatus Magasanikbacteria bacterium]HBX16079.1 hypothetical protein [Candidatus Magasanikbacteria bacterium]
MKKSRWYWLIVLVVILILGGLFYWYEWRPIKIRQECFKISQVSSQNITDINYKNCLRWSGLKY